MRKARFRRVESNKGFSRPRSSSELDVASRFDKRRSLKMLESSLENWSQPEEHRGADQICRKRALPEEWKPPGVAFLRPSNSSDTSNLRPNSEVPTEKTVLTRHRENGKKPRPNLEILNSGPTRPPPSAHTPPPPSPPTLPKSPTKNPNKHCVTETTTPAAGQPTTQDPNPGHRNEVPGTPVPRPTTHTPPPRPEPSNHLSAVF